MASNSVVLNILMINFQGRVRVLTFYTRGACFCQHFVIEWISRLVVTFADRRTEPR